MKFASLQLVTYVIEALHLDLNPNYRAETEAENDVDDGDDTFEVIPQVVSLPQGEKTGFMRLTIALNEERETWRYYRLRITIGGEFALLDKEPPLSNADLRAYVVQSGMSVLYGVARTMVLQMCASSPYPRLILPMITIGEEDVERMPEPEGTATASDQADAAALVRKKAVARKKLR